MKPEIVVALVGTLPALLSLLGVIVTNRTAQKAREIQHQAELDAIKAQNEATIADIRKDLQRLEHKQDLHNSLIERQYETERKVSVMQEQIRELQNG